MVGKVTWQFFTEVVVAGESTISDGSDMERLEFKLQITERDLRETFRCVLPYRARLLRVATYLVIWLLIFAPTLSILFIFAGFPTALLGLLLVTLLYFTSVRTIIRLPRHFLYLVGLRQEVVLTPNWIEIQFQSSALRFRWTAVRRITRRSGAIFLITDSPGTSPRIPQELADAGLDNLYQRLQSWRKASGEPKLDDNFLAAARMGDVLDSGELPIDADYYTAAPQFRGPGDENTLDAAASDANNAKPSNHLSLILLAGTLAIVVALFSEPSRWSFWIRVIMIIISLYLPAQCIRLFNAFVRSWIRLQMRLGRMKTTTQRFFFGGEAMGIEIRIAGQLDWQVLIRWEDVTQVFEHQPYLAMQYPLGGALFPLERLDKTRRQHFESAIQHYYQSNRMPIADLADMPDPPEETGNPYQSP